MSENLSDPLGKLDTVDIDPLANVFKTHFLGLPLLVLRVFGVEAKFMIMSLFWMRKEISEIRMKGQSRIVKGILGWTGVILHFGMELVHLLRIQMIWMMVVFNDKLVSDDVLADTSVSVHEEVPVLALQICTDEVVPLVSPVMDQNVRRIKDKLISQDIRMDEVSVLPWPICDPPIHHGTSDMGLSQGDTKWFCLFVFCRCGECG